VTSAAHRELRGSVLVAPVRPTDYFYQGMPEADDPTLQLLLHVAEKGMSRLASMATGSLLLIGPW
jgi:hypothetical protein